MVITAAIQRKKLAAAEAGAIEELEAERRQMRETLIYQVLIPGIVMLVTLLLLTLVGFYPASAFLVFTVYCYHDYRVDRASLKRQIYLKGAGFALLVTLFMYLIFTLALGLPAPSGVF